MTGRPNLAGYGRNVFQKSEQYPGSAVDQAARYLSSWKGAGMAWHADLDWVAPDQPDNPELAALRVVKRARLLEGAAKSLRGSGRVGQMREWKASGTKVVIPKHRSGADIAAALAMAQLDGPLEAILLLVCCEDLSQWPTVLRYGRVRLAHRFAEEALTDAMHRIMWRRPVMALEARAKSLGVRKDAYRLARVRAEEMLGGWTENAAVRFLLAFRSDA
ncbi:hypothetical protein N800_10205 [Lysobacter daejeonensis GH1-9]|uniref:Uncharacterized protein n=1 Tax=Lysobacter daejeonensis GH1-9 TaxID=1385517 RepID=A0A0A0EZM2_9GAMM|nr:hypothetical protein [Lysobacter daejeonensis]KGM55989.1 hypothetical protein N800_10205 [Lysobacter daejeonensis GH1-9]